MPEMPNFLGQAEQRYHSLANQRQIPGSIASAPVQSIAGIKADMERMWGARRPGGGSGTQDAMAEQERLRREFDRMIQANSSAQNFFNTDPMAQANQQFFQQSPFQSLMGMIQGRASGADQPFGQTVMAGFTGRAEDAAAGRSQADQRAIRSSMSRRGVGGSGQEMQALMNARRASAAQLRGSIRDINSRAALENFQAKTQAQSQLNDTLFRQLQAQEQMVGARAGAQRRGADTEIQLRSQQRLVK